MEREGRKVSEILIQQQNTNKQNKTHRNSHLVTESTFGGHKLSTAAENHEV